MADILVDPSKGSPSLKIKVDSLQVVGFDISVLDPSGNDAIPSIHGNSQTANPFISPLPNLPSYKGYTISGNFVIVDPNGAGNNYAVVFSITQGGTELQPAIDITGTTTQNKVTRGAAFHIK